MLTSLPQTVQKVCWMAPKCHHIMAKSPQDTNNKVPSLFCVLEFGFGPEGTIKILGDADYKDLI